MKILHAIHGFLPQFRGGTELYVHDLARRQRELGHDVEIVCGTTDFAAASQLERYEHDGFRVWKIVLAGSYLEHWTRSISPDAAAHFAEVVKAVRPDIVHVQHWYRLARNLVETCYRLGVPAVCTLHDLWTSCPRIFRIRQESFCERPLGAASCTDCVPRLPWMEDEPTARQIELFKDDFLNELRLAHRIIVPSAAHGALVRRMMEIPEDRFLVIPHGTIAAPVDGLPAAAPAPARARLGSSAKPKKAHPIRVGMWGHLFHMKGAHLLLEALRELDESARFDVHIWGKVVEPKYKERLERLANGLNVTWHGAFVPDDIRSQPLDVAVIPSLCSESYSFVLDEAFLLGLPAIVSDRGALAERIGKAGVAFEPESASDLARVLASLARDPGQIEAWRRQIPELLGMPAHARRIDDIYRDVIVEAPRTVMHPDMTLPVRRTRELAAQVREAEQLMFGYIGHIKRESGRGDHYEGVTKKMIEEQHAFGARINQLTDKAKVLEAELASKRALVEVLGREVADFREAIVLIHQESPRFARKLPAVPDTKEHVPGIGPASTFLSIDHEMMSRFAEKLLAIRQSIVDLREQLRDRERRTDEAIGLRRDREKKIDELNAAVADRDRMIKGRDHELADSRSQLKERDHQLALQMERLREVSEHTAELEKRNAGLAASRDESERRLVDLGARLREMDTRLEDAMHDSKTSSARAADLAVQLAEALPLASEAPKLREEAATLKAALKEKAASAEHMLRISNTLAGMIDTLRKAILKVHEADPYWQDTSHGLARDLRDFDAPNLGKLGDVIRRNSEAITGFLAEVRRLKKDAAQALEAQAKLLEATRATTVKDALIAHLAVFIEELRRALTMIFHAEPGFTADGRPIDGPPDHVPGLGDLPTIQKTNHELISTHLNELRTIKAELERLRA